MRGILAVLSLAVGALCVEVEVSKPISSRGCRPGAWEASGVVKMTEEDKEFFSQELDIRAHRDPEIHPSLWLTLCRLDLTACHAVEDVTPDIDLDILAKPTYGDIAQCACTSQGWDKSCNRTVYKVAMRLGFHLAKPGDFLLTALPVAGDGVDNDCDGEDCGDKGDNDVTAMTHVLGKLPGAKGGHSSLQFWLNDEKEVTLSPAIQTRVGVCPSKVTSVNICQAVGEEQELHLLLNGVATVTRDRCLHALEAFPEGFGEAEVSVTLSSLDDECPWIDSYDLFFEEKSAADCKDAEPCDEVVGDLLEAQEDDNEDQNEDEYKDEDEEDDRDDNNDITKINANDASQDDDGECDDKDEDDEEGYEDLDDDGFIDDDSDGEDDVDGENNEEENRDKSVNEDDEYYDYYVDYENDNDDYSDSDEYNDNEDNDDNETKDDSDEDGDYYVDYNDDDDDEDKDDDEDMCGDDDEDGDDHGEKDDDDLDDDDDEDNFNDQDENDDYFDNEDNDDDQTIGDSDGDNYIDYNDNDNDDDKDDNEDFWDNGDEDDNDHGEKDDDDQFDDDNEDNNDDYYEYNNYDDKDEEKNGKEDYQDNYIDYGDDGKDNDGDEDDDDGNKDDGNKDDENKKDSEDLWDNVDEVNTNDDYYGDDLLEDDNNDKDGDYYDDYGNNDFNKDDIEDDEEKKDCDDKEDNDNDEDDDKKADVLNNNTDNDWISGDVSDDNDNDDNNGDGETDEENNDSENGLGVNDIMNEDQFDLYNPPHEPTPPWSVLQRRDSGELSFNRSMQDYMEGFGGDEESGEWMGLACLHDLCNSESPCRLRLYLTTKDGRKRRATYAMFYIASEAAGWRAYVSSSKWGTAGNGMKTAHNSIFSISQEANGGWWLPENMGQGGNLNAAWQDDGLPGGDWVKDGVLKDTLMEVRPLTPREVAPIIKKALAAHTEGQLYADY